MTQDSKRPVSKKKPSNIYAIDLHCGGIMIHAPLGLARVYVHFVISCETPHRPSSTPLMRQHGNAITIIPREFISKKQTSQKRGATVMT